MTTALVVLIAAAAGAAVSSLVAILPGLHVYNILGALVLVLAGMQETGAMPPPEVGLPFVTGLIVGWSMLNTVPSVLLGAPDESAIFTVLPGQKYLMQGRGYEGAMMTAVGGLAGVFVVVLVVGPLAPRVLPLARAVFAPHVHWILWVLTTYILMSEWPKGGNLGPAGWRKFADAWGGLAAGLATFLLSGLLGFLLVYRSPISTEAAFQNLLPAFAGLFAVPWCLFNVLSAVDPPAQHCPKDLEVDADVILRSAAAGGLGGGFAAFFPVVTGGVGGLLAGHATAQRDERVFIMSQGASKLVYYVGGFLLLFVPGLHVRRGGAAWMTQFFFTPLGRYEYFMILAAIAISGAVSFLMMSPLTRATIWLIGRWNYRYLSLVALAIVAATVFAVTGWTGVAVMLVAAGIGSLPVLFGSRRLNCLGILLLPMACNMSGFGADVARVLGLL